MKHVLRIFGFYIGCFALAVCWAALTEPSQDNVTLDDHVPGRIHLLTEPNMTDCYEQGNLICGDKDNVLAEQAWATWDAVGGWKYLRVDPNRECKVEYVGTAMAYPRLGVGEVALPSTDGGYWVFRAHYVDSEPTSTP